MKKKIAFVALLLLSFSLARADGSRRARTPNAASMNQIRARIHQRFFPLAHAAGRQKGLSDEQIINEWVGTLNALDDNPETASQLMQSLEKDAGLRGNAGRGSARSSKGGRGGGGRDDYQGWFDSRAMGDFNQNYDDPQALARGYEQKTPEQDEFGKQAWKWLSHNEDGSLNALGEFESDMKKKKTELQDDVKGLFPTFDDKKDDKKKKAGGKK